MQLTPGAETSSAGERVRAFRAWLAALDPAELTDRERVDLVVEIERDKGGGAAAQARLTHALRQSREASSPHDAIRSVGAEVALARRESPTLGDRFVGMARALVDEMPCTMQALSSGSCSERHALLMVQATSALSRAHRAEVDRRVGPLLGRLGRRGAERAARRVAQELDAASVVRRMEDAVRSRRVTVRPAPDGMAYLTVLGPMVEVVGASAALRARSQRVATGQAPDEGPDGRSAGAIAADTALSLLSGRAVGELQPVEVHLVMTDRALLGTGDPDRSVMEPARIPGHGSVPAPSARARLRTDPALPSPVGTATGGRANAVASVWLRRLYTSPDGRDLVAMDSHRRLFDGLLRRMLVLRDDVCTTPWCEAPIAHADHTTPVRAGGVTSFRSGTGKCERCNYGKEAPGWVTTAEPVVDSHVEAGLPPRTGPPPESGSSPDPAPPRHRVHVTTPTGRRYASEPPPLLGWGSIVAVGPQQPVDGHGPSGSHPDDGAGADRPAARARVRGIRRRRRPHRDQGRLLVRRQLQAQRVRSTSHLEQQLCRYLT